MKRGRAAPYQQRHAPPRLSASPSQCRGAGSLEEQEQAAQSSAAPAFVRHLARAAPPGSGGDDGGGCRERRRPGRFPEPEQRWRRWTSTDKPPDRSVSRGCGPGLRQHACAHEPLCDLGDRPIIPKLRSEVTLTLLCWRKITPPHTPQCLQTTLSLGKYKASVGQATPWLSVTLVRRDELPHISKTVLGC